MERRESVVRRLLSFEVSVAALAQETGISQGTLYNWRNEAQHRGEAVVRSVRHPGKRSSGERLAVVVETFALNEAELAEYCRKKGLYPEEVRAWRTQAERAMAGSVVSAKELGAAVAAEKKRAKALERELKRKEKALAETAALLTLRKKAAAIWGEAEDA
jgi:transposase-like protein